LTSNPSAPQGAFAREQTTPRIPREVDRRKSIRISDLRVTPPLRILLIVESSAGGTGRQVLDLADGLIARGHDVHFAHSTIRIDQLFRDRLAEIPRLRCTAHPMAAAPGPRDLRLVRTLKRILKEHGPFDIVHGHSSKGGALARLAAMGTNARAYYTLHGLIMMDPGLSRAKSLFYLTIELLLSRRTAGIIAVAPEEARAVRKLGLGRSKIHTVPNGLGHLPLRSRAEARAAMGVDEDNVVIGFVGRLVSQKALDVLIAAFATASAVAPNARLGIVGDGPLRSELENMASKLGISSRIIWLGECDARTFLAGFDLFAISSQKEGLPYVVLEAMLTGLPVVATASAGLEILVEPDVNGSVVEMGNVTAFAAALVPLLRDPQLRVPISSASMRWWKAPSTSIAACPLRIRLCGNPADPGTSRFARQFAVPTHMPMPQQGWNRSRREEQAHS
jgi:glycosyltransferase involved in cell wall biosynthesis